MFTMNQCDRSILFYCYITLLSPLLAGYYITLSLWKAKD